MDSICQHFLDGFSEALKKRSSFERRIGSELKFPVVNPDGSAVSYEVIDALWQYLCDNGWKPEIDSVSGKIVGARKPGEQNETVASCETGYCKSEFSLAHVSNLHDLSKAINELKAELKPFCEKRNVRFLAYGIQPVTPPSKRLLMKKSRTSVWDKIFGSNDYIAEEDGDDMHLFTINAASHVHVSVSEDESIPAVNVLNGFSGAQLALTGHSNIWKGNLDPEHKCVSEMFWDWWMKDSTERVGVPEKPFESMADYADTIASFKPVFVKREGQPLVLSNYDTFADYYSEAEAVCFDIDGNQVCVSPNPADIDLHSTCYWFNARLSHYYTVENRVCDQQPPDELISIPALTLGLVSALPEATEAICGYEWDTLKESRITACKNGLEGQVNGSTVKDIAKKMLELARVGLERRGLGEEKYLAALESRLEKGQSPADEAADIFNKGGIDALIAARSL